MKKIIIGLVMLLFAISFAVAGTYVSPTSSSTIRGNTVFNVTQAGADLNNCSISGSSALGADTMTATLYNLTGTEANATVDTTSLTDASDWTFTGTCYNTSGSSYSITAITGVTVDNTAPTLTLTSTQASNKATDRSVAWTATCANTVSATIKFGVNQYTMTRSGSTCSFDTSAVPASTYSSVVVTATDGLNSTSLTYTNVGVSDKASRAVALIGTQYEEKLPSDGKVNTSNTNMTVLVVLGIAAVAIYFLTKKKK